MTTVADYNVDATLSGRCTRVDLLSVHQHHRIVVRRPVIWRPNRVLVSAHGSGLLVPAPWTDDYHPISHILAAVYTARTHADSKPVILVIGHTTEDEDPSLGTLRSEAIRCLLQNDARAWVQLASSSGSIRDVKAYLQYLNATLGWDCFVAEVDAAVDSATEAAVRDFQHEYNSRFERKILEDGVCGKDTLAAVFEVLSFEWEKWLFKHDLTQSDLDELDIRYSSAADVDRTLAPLRHLAASSAVEFLVIDRAALGGEDASPSLVYGSEVARFETFRVPREPWAWERGPYTVVSDLFADEFVFQEHYRMRSMDGEFELTLAMPDDAVDRGLLMLEFPALPCDKSYELTVSSHDGTAHVLFQDVPYNKLHQLATEGAIDDPGSPTDADPDEVLR